jgi:lysophospholipase L1-like esterase
MKLYLLFASFFVVTAFMPQKKTRVIFFGDSITEMGARPGGYIMKIDSLCKLDNKQDNYEFVGAGVSANKVYDLYLRLEDDVLSKNPDVVVIYIGVNDVWHKTSRGTGTDPDKFERFYNAILKKLKDRNIKAILATPAVIGEKTDFTNQLDGDLNLYSQLIRNIATKSQLPLVDLRKAFLDHNKVHNPQNKEQGILTYDRVHLNDAGNLLVAKEMWMKLKDKN